MFRSTAIGAGILSLAFVPQVLAGQCGSSSDDAVAKAKVVSASWSDQKDIVDTAVAAGSFNTLAAALKSADLINTLKSDGPFTVFAPTDEAFAKLPKGTVNNLLKPENRDQLVAILTYHVVPGRLDARDVMNQSGAVTVNGERLNFATMKKFVRIDGAMVTKANIECSNGVIHVIDSVILPASDSIVETAQSAGVFGTLLTAATEAGLAPVLANEGPLTIFAPTDDAFAKLPKGTVENLLKPENRDQLVAILKYHIVPGRLYADQAIAAGSATTLQGDDISISVTDEGTLRVNGASIVQTNIDASNGVIYVIDSVILPG